MLAVEQAPGYTMKQASMIIGCHEKVIYQLAKDQKIDTYFGLDNRMMVTREEVYHYLRNRK